MPVLRIRLAALVLAGCALAPVALAQVTTEEPRPDPAVTDTLGVPLEPEVGAPAPGAKVEYAPKIYAPLLWSPTAGFGLGYGVEIKNLGWAESSLLVTGLTSQRIGRYGVYANTRTPYAPGFGAMLGATYETTGRRYFYGVGPFAKRTDRIAVEKQTVEAELRLGYATAPQGRRRVQAFGRYQLHPTRTATDLSSGARGRLDAASEANLAYALDHDIGAVTVGVEGLWDERSSLYVPRFGFIGQLGASYTTAVAGSDVSFVRTYGSFNYFLPIPWRTSTVALRTVVSTIDGVRGGLAGATGSGQVPFVLLPTFDTDYSLGLATQRYYSKDFFLLGGELHTPLLISGIVDIDGIASATTYNSYDDIVRQFMPIPSLGKTRPRSGRYPLQTALGGGFRLSSSLVPGFVFHTQMGFGPEGLSITFFDLVADLRAARPVLRGL